LKYKSNFTNKDGEDWVFEFDLSTNIAKVMGVDVGWAEYPVIEGYAINLVLDCNERAWIENSWNEVIISMAWFTFMETKKLSYYTIINSVT